MSTSAFAATSFLGRFRPLLLLALLVLRSDLGLRAEDHATGAPPFTSIRVELALKGPVTAPLEGELTLRSQDPPAATVSVHVSGQAATVTSLPAGRAWEASVAIPGYWSRRETVTSLAEQPAVVRVDLWPLGKIAAVVGSTAPALLPKDATVVTLAPRHPDRKDHLPKGTMRCPLDAHRRWTCELPATTYDFAVSLPELGVAPYYLRGVTVPPGNVLDLGPIQFSSGASVAGWAEAELGAISSQCLARLALLPEAGNTSPRLPLETKVASDGFFQFSAVPVGKYLLEIEQPGYKPARISPVAISSASSARYFEGSIVMHPRPLDLARQQRPVSQPDRALR